MIVKKIIAINIVIISLVGTVFADPVTTIATTSQNITSTTSATLDPLTVKIFKYLFYSKIEKIPTEFKPVEKELGIYIQKSDTYSDYLNSQYKYIVELENTSIVNSLGAKKKNSEILSKINEIKKRKKDLKKSVEDLNKALDKKIKDSKIKNKLYDTYLKNEYKMLDSYFNYESNILELMYNSASFYSKIGNIGSNFQTSSGRLVFEDPEVYLDYLNYLNNSRKINKAIINNIDAINAVLQENYDFYSQILSDSDLKLLKDNIKDIKDIKDNLYDKSESKEVYNEVTDVEFKNRLEADPEYNIPNNKIRTLLYDIFASQNNYKIKKDDDFKKAMAGMSQLTSLYKDRNKIGYKIQIKYEKDIPKNIPIFAFYIFAKDSEVKDVNKEIEEGIFYSTYDKVLRKKFEITNSCAGKMDYTIVGTSTLDYIFWDTTCANKYQMLKLEYKNKFKNYFENTVEL